MIKDNKNLSLSLFHRKKHRKFEQEAAHERSEGPRASVIAVCLWPGEKFNSSFLQISVVQYTCKYILVAIVIQMIILSRSAIVV